MEYLLLLGVVGLFLSGAPLFAVIVGFSLVGGMATTRGEIWESFGTNLVDVISMGTSDKAKILSTIPLFIFIGYVLAAGKTADRMVRAAQSALGWLPGGLAIVTIFACAAFTTFTGASGVTIVALGSLILPSLIKEKYPERFSLGLVAGTGSVGLLFPPAVPLFVFSTMYGLAFQGVVKEYPNATPLDAGRWLFAGIVPGLVLCGILCFYAVAVAVRHKVPRHKFDPREFGRAMFTALPELLLPVLIIGGLAKGIDVPEIASLAVVYVVLIEVFLYKDVRIRDLAAISKDSMALVGAIFIIIFTAQGLANYFVTAGIPEAMVRFFTEHIDQHQWWLFLLAVNLILIIAGMVMDIFSAIVIIVPLLAL
ncbi:MAG TPA: TRAP transporter large permease, partial [Kofleriaceae bacterium]|nr:TRAP transporter large permease [Kofleriaceae bacterium]